MVSVYIAVSPSQPDLFDARVDTGCIPIYEGFTPVSGNEQTLAIFTLSGPVFTEEVPKTRPRAAEGLLSFEVDFYGNNALTMDFDEV